MAKSRSILMALFLSAASLLAPHFAQAAGPGFNNLSQDDFDKAIRELSANSSYHSVTGAGTLGSIFGFEVALVGGLSNTPDINAYSKQVDASADISRLPHAALLLGASVPLGFTGELLFFPESSFSSVKYQQFGASVKWTATDLLVLPFNLAVRGFMTSNKMSFNQVLQNSSTGNVPTDVTVTQDNSQIGVQLLASPNLPFVEPYVGIGTIKANGKLAVSGTTTGTIFGFTSAQSAESSPVSTQLLVGVNVNLLIVNLGLEWSRAFERDSYNLKLGLRF